MEFGFEPAATSYEQIRAINDMYIYTYSSNLLEARRKPVRSQIPLRYPGRRQVRSWFEPACELDSAMEFGVY